MCIFGNNYRHFRALYWSIFGEVKNIVWSSGNVLHCALGFTVGDCVSRINSRRVPRTTCILAFDIVLADYKNNIGREVEDGNCKLVLLYCFTSLALLGNLLLLFQLILIEHFNNKREKL